MHDRTCEGSYHVINTGELSSRNAAGVGEHGFSMRIVLSNSLDFLVGQTRLIKTLLVQRALVGFMTIIEPTMAAKG